LTEFHLVLPLLTQFSSALSGDPATLWALIAEGGRAGAAHLELIRQRELHLAGG